MALHKLSQDNLYLNFKWFSLYTSLIVAISGAAVLVGWHFDIVLLKRILPDMASMKVNGAIAFVLLAISVLLISDLHRRKRLYTFIGDFFATLVILIGALTISQYAFDINIGIDNLFYQDTPRPGRLNPPGRLSHISAIYILGTGVAILLINSRQRSAVITAQFLALIGTMSGLMSLSGYMYEVKILYSVFPYSSVALHTSILSILLGLSILTNNPSNGLIRIISDEHHGGFMARRLLPFGIIGPLIIGWLVLEGEHQGFYNANLRPAIFATASALVVTIVIWWTARTLNRLDREKQDSESKVIEADDKMVFMAFHDELTMLPNRRLLEERLKEIYGPGVRKEKRLYGALLYIDWDNIKALNDKEGFKAGDELLVQIANRIKMSVREADFVARYGNDEFIVLLDALSERENEAITMAEKTARKILATLSQTYVIGKIAYTGTACAGISMYSNQDGNTEDLLKRAEFANNQAKVIGKNTVSFFDPIMQFNYKERVALEKDLHTALLEKQFELYYQMQVYRNGHIHAAEVLIRWRHPTRGMVSPMEFIAAAEASGLIIPIGQWVLETACEQLKIWESDPRTKFIKLAVNVSACQFQADDYVDQVANVINKSGINPNMLDLELTESMALADIEKAIYKMHELKAMGLHLSFDDFGTGYSSLAYLSRLPLDKLKIDQSFTNNIEKNSRDTVIVKTIINMAHSLGFEVIAEGVETEEQRQFLTKHGCPVYQGYLFSKPIPIKEFEEILLSEKQFKLTF